MKSKSKSYLDYFINPLDLLSTQKVLHVNPTVAPERKDDIVPIISLYEYNQEKYSYKRLKDIEHAFPFLENNTNTWINVDGLLKKDVDVIAERFGIHSLTVEDILSLGQRPKFEELNNMLYCVLSIMYFNDAKQSVEAEQISLILGKTFVITFQEDQTRDVFNPIREKIKLDGSKVRSLGTDFLYYNLIDAIVDNYYIVMEKLADLIEDLEERVIKMADKNTLAEIAHLRKEMIFFKRNINPVRDMINAILRSETDLIDERIEKYFKDIYDHITQANELTENYRDMMLNLHDLYVNNVNLKMNEVMKVMAVVTCLLAPATVIGGIFGMNFERMPILHNQWGFFISVGLMLVIPLIMIYIFRKRGWF